MRILVLGGTRFVGRAVVDAALAAGHEVTLFNRGITGPSLYPAAETVIGDRTRDLSVLRGRRFDAVFDTAGYDPAVVALSVSALRDTVDRYVFVSTVSVYADQSVPASEGSDLLADQTYGGRKAACERVVREAFGGRALIPRPGLIVGPHDATERFLYWPRRIARGGQVLAPGDPADPVQWVDVRDLGEWIVTTSAAGVFNTVRPTLTMGEFLQACGPAELTWVATKRLLELGVEPWMGVPMWIGDPAASAANLVDGTRAIEAGMTHRPVATVVADAYAWDLSRGGPAEEPLTPDAEAALLAKA
jgi:2'-hydroxyisoflavone reductase